MKKLTKFVIASLLSVGLLAACDLDDPGNDPLLDDDPGMEQPADPGVDDTVE